MDDTFLLEPLWNTLRVISSILPFLMIGGCPWNSTLNTFCILPAILNKFNNIVSESSLSILRQLLIYFFIKVILKNLQCFHGNLFFEHKCNKPSAFAVYLEVKSSHRSCVTSFSPLFSTMEASNGSSVTLLEWKQIITIDIIKLFEMKFKLLISKGEMYWYYSVHRQCNTHCIHVYFPWYNVMFHSYMCIHNKQK